MKKIISCVCIAAIPFAFVACGTNPIEAEEDLNGELFSDKTTSLNKMDKELAKIDFYKCKQAYNATRCNNFYAKYGSYEAEQIADTLNFDDRGSYIGSSSSVPASSSSDVSSSSGASSSSEALKYLENNTGFKITLTSYEQTAENISESKKEGNPEVRFSVKTYSDDELVNTQVTGLLLDKTKTTSWKGENSAVVTIPRGVDKVVVCPLVIDENDEDDVDLKAPCAEAFVDLGLMKIGKITEETTTGKVFEAAWNWQLFDLE